MACILCMPLGTFAQRVTHTYNNVSLSKALLQLNSKQKEYVIQRAGGLSHHSHHQE